MSWTGSASAVLAISGIGMTAYLIQREEKKELWLPLLYFTLMEILQALTYFYINECNSPTNRALTFLAYVHIAFQPFFINMLAMHFIPKEIKNKISKYAYAACWIGAGFYMLKAYPFSNTYLCVVGQEAFCGRWACAYKGTWHLAWQWPLNTLGSSSPWIDVPPKEYVTGIEARSYMFQGNWEYVWQWLRDTLGTQPLLLLSPHIYLLGLHVQTFIFCGFIMPLLYGSWRIILLMFVLGPLLASFATQRINEFPALCSLGFWAICFLIALLPIRNFLFVKKWVFHKPILKFVKN